MQQVTEKSSPELICVRFSLYFPTEPQAPCRFCCETPEFLRTKYLHLKLAFLIKVNVVRWCLHGIQSQWFVRALVSSAPHLSLAVLYHLPNLLPQYKRVSLQGVCLWPWRDNFDLFKDLHRGILCFRLQKRRGSKRTGLGNRRHKGGGISAHLLCPGLHCWGWPSAIPDSGGKRINLEKGVFLQNHIFSNSVEIYFIISTKLLINHIHTLYIIDTYYDICDLLEGIFTIQLCWKKTPAEQRQSRFWLGQCTQQELCDNVLVNWFNLSFDQQVSFQCALNSFPWSPVIHRSWMHISLVIHQRVRIF